MTPSYWDRYSTHPAEGLTPTRLASALKMAESGSLTTQAELFEDMEEKDSQIFSCLQTRKMSVVNKDREIIPASEDAKDEDIADFVRQVFDNIPDFESNLLDILDAIGKGFSVLEIMWEASGGQVGIGDLEWINQKRFVMGDDNALRLLNAGTTFEGEEMPPNKFVTHLYRGRSGLPNRGGLLRTVAWMYLFKNYDIKDWVAFTEIYGIPMRLGKYSGTTGDPDIDVLKDALENLGSDFWALIHESTDITFPEVRKQDSVSIYKDLAEFCDKSIAKAILGQTETVESTPGKLGAAKEKSDVRQDLVEADAKSLQKTISTQLILPLVKFNFGEQDVYPRLKIKYEPPEDLLTEARKDAILIKSGMPIGVSYARKKYAIPEPEEGEDILTPPQANPMGMPAMKDGSSSLTTGRTYRRPEKKKHTTIFEMKDIDPRVKKNLRPILKLENESIRDAVIVYDELIDTLRIELTSTSSLPSLRGRLTDLSIDSRWVRKAAPIFLKAIAGADGIGRSQVQEELKRAVDLRSERRVMADVPVGVNWNIRPEEALEWFRLQSFTIADVENRELLAYCQNKVDDAIAKGRTFSNWLDGVNDLFDAYGVTRKEKYHLQTVFQTNIQSTYNAGRWAEYHDPDVAGFFPYFQYQAVDDDRTRYSHRIHDGAIYRKDDPFWNEWWPPNGYNCFPAGYPVKTSEGLKNIEKINKNDLVLTHKNRYRQVLGTMEREYEGDLIKLEFEDGRVIEVTPNHKILTEQGWIPADQLKGDEEVITLC